MRLNVFEYALMHNPLRPYLQDILEVRQLRCMGGPVTGARVLEIGCGSGAGIDLILSRFGAAEVDAFDLDPRAVHQAHQRYGRRIGTVRLWVGNVRRIPTRNNHYDAVFGFGVLHHVVNWRAALVEIHRVLKPGGRFYCEEILKKYITLPLIRRLLKHPQQDRFNDEAFAKALTQAGFQVIKSKTLFDLYAWHIADKP